MQDGMVLAEGARLCEPQHCDWLTIQISPYEVSLLLPYGPIRRKLQPPLPHFSL